MATWEPLHQLLSGVDSAAITGGPHNSAVILVSCSKDQRDHAAPARDLYDSTLFRKASEYADRSHLRWFILSSEHGLVEPDEVLEPYDTCLRNESREYRAEWGVRVVRQLEERLGPLTGRVIEIHAGAFYISPLEPLLKRLGAHIVEPLAGLAVGRRLQWYNAQRQCHSADRTGAG